MKCHYTVVDGGKVWIPGCYSGIYSEGYCSCRVHEKELQKQWKENDPEFKARKENEELWKENARLKNPCVEKYYSSMSKEERLAEIETCLKYAEFVMNELESIMTEEEFIQFSNEF